MSAPTVPRIRRVDTADPDELGAAQPEKRRGYEQLGRGRFRGSLVDARLPRVQIFRERFSKSMRLSSLPGEGLQPIGIPLVGGTRFRGQPFEPGQLVLTGEEWDVSTRDDFDYVALVFDRRSLEEELEARGHAADELGRLRGSILDLPSAGVERFRDDLLAALARVAAAPVGLTDAAELEDELVSRFGALLDRAAGVDRARRRIPGRQRHAVLRRVTELLADLDDAAPLTVPELSAAAGVSQRALAYAFREQLGITPKRYLRVRRLNLAQRQLREADPAETTVTAVATGLGFTELGRFSTEYRQLFGERPSETLART